MVVFEEEIFDGLRFNWLDKDIVDLYIGIKVGLAAIDVIGLVFCIWFSNETTSSSKL